MTYPIIRHDKRSSSGGLTWRRSLTIVTVAASVTSCSPFSTARAQARRSTVGEDNGNCSGGSCMNENVPLHHSYPRGYTVLSLASGSRGSRTSTSTSNDEDDVTESMRYSSGSKTDVKNRLPYEPTRPEIESLKVVELRDACSERGLIRSGKKDQLRSRLLEWVQSRHVRKVNERRTKPDFYDGVRERKIASSISSTPVADILDYRVLPLQEATEIRVPKERLPLEPVIGCEDVNSSVNSYVSSDVNSDVDSDVNSNSNDMGEDELDELYQECDPLSLFVPSADYLSQLKKTFKKSTTEYSNLDVKQMYYAAKLADQRGDTETSKSVLRKLLAATPNDGRIHRRLARLSSEEGDLDEARKILQMGCRTNPKNAYLWHGLGQLNVDCHDYDQARVYFKEAMNVDPNFPNPYHAWGRLEHKEGNIRLAMALLKKGVKECPSNHRLYHALGGLLREAGMLDQADAALRKGIKCGPNWSRSFFCTDLAYVAYDRGNLDECQDYLKKGVRLNKMHAQGWLALAQLQESEGRFDPARETYSNSLGKYERARNIFTFSPEIETSKTRRNIVPLRSGDKWISVYKSWARMEESLNNIQAAEDIYSRASLVFPTGHNLLISWVNLLGNDITHYRQANDLFQRACEISGSRNADPYRLHADYETSLGNYQRAQAIFYKGAESVCNSSDGQPRGLATLFYSWALLEWEHLQNNDRAKQLFEHGLRLTRPDDQSDIRVKIMKSMAEFQFEAENYRIAQHFICLAIHEGDGGDFALWDLWGDVAERSGDHNLSKQCRDEAERRCGLPFEYDAKSVENAALSLVKGPEMKKMLCKAPWHKKLFPTSLYGVEAW